METKPTLTQIEANEISKKECEQRKEVQQRVKRKRQEEEEKEAKRERKEEEDLEKAFEALSKDLAQKKLAREQEELKRSMHVDEDDEVDEHEEDDEVDEHDEDDEEMETKPTFDNQYFLSRKEENKKSKKIEIIQAFKQIVPTLTEDQIVQLNQTSISIQQSRNSKNGTSLENDIGEELDKNNISYEQQVEIDKSGIILRFKDKKDKDKKDKDKKKIRKQEKGQCYHRVDFVVGENIEVGKSITDYKVVSCKTTCRDRWTQDDWTYTFPPTVYILVVTSDSYPPSERFRENTNRKIITCIPKKKDDRMYKLSFENLIDELQL